MRSFPLLELPPVSFLYRFSFFVVPSLASSPAGTCTFLLVVVFVALSPTVDPAGNVALLRNGIESSTLATDEESPLQRYIALRKFISNGI